MEIYGSHTPSVVHTLLTSATLCCSFLGAIYFKNTICKYWKARFTKEPGEVVYIIAEPDKAIVRQHIIEGVVQSPLKIR